MNRVKRGNVQSGLDVFLETGLPQLQGQRVGLITTTTGADSRLHSTVDLLRADRRIELRALFGPEHGLRGDAQAGVGVESAVDSRTGLPVHSLYGKTQRPTAEMLEGLDALIYDIQDIGARYATHIATLLYTQQAAAQANLQYVVFDRPNPITGTILEGNMLDPAFTSFVGAHPLPTRHGLTVGELARLFAAEHGWPEPIVIPMRGWHRDMWFDETGLPWIQPTPNLPTLDSLTLYPGTCLIEGTNGSEGRGTTRPFEVVGAPGLDPFQLAEELTARDLSGVAFRPTYFTPTFSKHAQTPCAGVQMYIIDRNALRPVILGLHLLDSIRKLQPETFAWRRGGSGKYFIDLLFGSDGLRRALDAGTQVADIVAGWDQPLADFKQRRQPFLLYAEEE